MEGPSQERTGRSALPLYPLGVGALAPTFPLPLCHPERSSPIFSSAQQFRASGCGVEGPWQHLNLKQAPRASNQLDRREAWVRSSPLLRRPGLQPVLSAARLLCPVCLLPGRAFRAPRASPGPKGPGANHPQTILPPIPFSALTHPPVISTGMNDSFRFSLRGWPTLRPAFLRG